MCGSRWARIESGETRSIVLYLGLTVSWGEAISGKKVHSHHVLVRARNIRSIFIFRQEVRPALCALSKTLKQNVCNRKSL